MRLDEHPILTFQRGKEVSFTHDGKGMRGFEGEPIAVALHAAGVKVLSHSLVKHRPRGFFCAIGNCSSCLMTVNEMPNVRTCTEPLVAGMRVETQEGRGSLLGKD